MKYMRILGITGGALGTALAFYICLVSDNMLFEHKVILLCAGWLMLIGLVALIVFFSQEWFYQAYSLQQQKYEYRRLVMQLENKLKDLNHKHQSK